MVGTDAGGIPDMIAEGETGRRRRLDEFDVATTTRRVGDLYERLLAEKGII